VVGGDVVEGEVVGGDVVGDVVAGGEVLGVGLGSGVGAGVDAGAGAGAAPEGAAAGDAAGAFLAGALNRFGTRPPASAGEPVSVGAVRSVGKGAGGGGIVPNTKVVVVATDVGVERLSLSALPSSRVIVVITAAKPRMTRHATTRAGTSSRRRFVHSPLVQGRE
jgi:hypothetical protein